MPFLHSYWWNESRHMDRCMANTMDDQERILRSESGPNGRFLSPFGQ